ncbi:hypothetical protein P3X46_026547 [Hevea brasiliensis]|uniref:F-box domain-containing protein n=1 Tax=Hevea brasiliensis TaxID=3981 RepID=A0ABQ9KYP0_HEVBR|nr:hypothetical protein P3X46_026547 [Hevea brasiliensis]
MKSSHFYHSLQRKSSFFSLCNNPVLMDDAKKSFSLDKSTGKKCYMLAARGLMIAWGGNPQCWIWKNVPYSRFTEVAELKFVWWLEIRGKIDTSMISPITNYVVAYLVFKMRTDARGFILHPIDVSVGISRSTRRSHMLRLRHPNRSDGWLEVELGEYFKQCGNDGEVLEMSAMEVNDEKSGLIVQGIEIRPKAV